MYEVENEKFNLKFYQTDNDFRNNTVTVEIMPKKYADELKRMHDETISRLMQSISETNPDTTMPK